jgi:hypothetical protein
LLLCGKHPRKGKGGEDRLVNLSMIYHRFGNHHRYLPLMHINSPSLPQDYVGLAQVMRCEHPCAYGDAYPGFYTVKANGTFGATVIDHFDAIGGWAWSPDGHYFIYGHEDGYKAWLVPLQGGDSQVIEGIVGSYSYLWSPDSRWVVIASPQDISIYEIETNRITTLDLPADVAPGRLVWSPDSRRLAWTTGQGEISVWYWTVGSTEPRRVAVGTPDELSLVWSLDGTHLFYTQGYNDPHLYVITDNSLTPTLFLEGFAVEGWLANGSRLLLRHDGKLYTSPLTTPVPTLFFDDAPVIGVRISPKGKEAVIESTTDLYLQLATSNTALSLNDCAVTLWNVQWQSDGTRMTCTAANHGTSTAVLDRTTTSPTMLYFLEDHNTPQFLPYSTTLVATCRTTYDTSPGYPVPTFHGTHLFNHQRGDFDIIPIAGDHPFRNYVVEWRYLP